MFFLILFASFGFASPTLDYDKFMARVSASDVVTVEDGLKKLRADYADDLGYYVLGYQSRSIQRATPLAPRAIVFGQKGTFVFAFNGDPKLPRYNTIETMSYDEAKREYSFREIHFKKEPGRLELPAEDIESETENLIISRANPSRCLMCHDTVRPRPNWQGAPLWPGYYGSNADALFAGKGAHIPPLRQEPGTISNEESNWAAFNTPEHRGSGRYQYLSAMKTQQPNFMMSVLFREQAKEAIADKMSKSKSVGFAFYTVTVCQPKADHMHDIVPARLRKLMNPYAEGDSVYKEMVLDHAEKNNLRDMAFMDKLEGKKLIPDILEDLVPFDDPAVAIHLLRMEKISVKLAHPALTLPTNVSRLSPVIDTFLRASSGFALSFFSPSAAPSNELHDGNDNEFGIAKFLREKLLMQYPSAEFSKWLKAPASLQDCGKMTPFARGLLDADVAL